MKPLQLVLTVLLVAGGIFVYDAVVRDPAATPSPLDGDFEPLRAHAEDADHEPDLRLEGLGDELWREELERRLALLEERPPAAGRTTVVADSGARGAATGGPDFAEGVMDAVLEVADVEGDRGAEDGAAAPGSHGPIDPAELADFRRKLDAVERQRRLQRSVRTINGALRRMGLSLSDDQRKEVVKSTLTLQGRLRQLRRAPARDQAAREERRTAYQSLRNDYTRSLEAFMPTEDAQKFSAGVMRASLGPRQKRDPAKGARRRER